MGYRSEVQIRVYGDEAEVIAFVAAEKLRGSPKGLAYHPLDPPDTEWTFEYRDLYKFDEDEDLSRYIKPKQGQLMISFSFAEVKWYPSYPEVEYWEGMFSRIVDTKNSLCGEFVRVGEEHTDVVIEHYGDDCRYFLDATVIFEDDSPTRGESDGSS
jgi:hypothetical protein